MRHGICQVKRGDAAGIRGNGQRRGGSGAACAQAPGDADAGQWLTAGAGDQRLSDVDGRAISLHVIGGHGHRHVIDGDGSERRTGIPGLAARAGCHGYALRHGICQVKRGDTAGICGDGQRRGGGGVACSQTPGDADAGHWLTAGAGDQRLSNVGCCAIGQRIIRRHSNGNVLNNLSNKRGIGGFRLSERSGAQFDSTRRGAAKVDSRMTITVGGIVTADNSGLRARLPRQRDTSHGITRSIFYCYLRGILIPAICLAVVFSQLQVKGCRILNERAWRGAGKRTRRCSNRDLFCGSIRDIHAGVSATVRHAADRAESRVTRHTPCDGCPADRFAI